MMRIGRLAAMAAVGIAAMGTSDGSAQPKPAAEACPATFQSVGQSVGTAVLDCQCAPGQITGSVWGTDIYTDDSSICAAARHAGMIGPGGGPVIVYAAPGQAGYPASSRHGIASADWGEWGASFTFVPSTGALPPPPGPPCPDSFVGHRDDPAPLSCTCPPGAAVGTVWGAGPYTDDSALCTAARHAGAIGPGGGGVTVIATPGRDSYAADAANGVTTSSYGAWGYSFWFLGIGKP